MTIPDLVERYCDTLVLRDEATDPIRIADLDHYLDLLWFQLTGIQIVF